MHGRKLSFHLPSHIFRALAICVLTQFTAAQSYNIVDLGLLPGTNSSWAPGLNGRGYVVL